MKMTFEYLESNQSETPSINFILDEEVAYPNMVAEEPVPYGK